MADEMLCCDIDQFLCHYAPFCPTDNSIDSALKKLEHKGLLLDNGWRDFRGNWTDENETEAFKKLEDIVKALRDKNASALTARPLANAISIIIIVAIHTWLGKFQEAHFE